MFTGGDESILGAVMVDIAVNKLQEQGLDIKDAIRGLRKAIGNYNPLHISAYVSDFEIIPPLRTYRYPLKYLFIALAIIAATAI